MSVVGFTTGGPLALGTAAIQTRLKLVFPENRFTHRIVPARMDGAAWKRLIGDGRFVGLGWAHVEPGREGGRLFQGDAAWAVFVAVRNPKGAAAAMLGDAAGPGLLALVQAAVAVLHGFAIDGVGSVLVTSVQNAYAEGWDAEDGLAMAAVQIGMPIALTLPDGLSIDTPDMLLRVASTWAFADGSTVGPDVINVGTP